MVKWKIPILQLRVRFPVAVNYVEYITHFDFFVCLFVMVTYNLKKIHLESSSKLSLDILVSERLSESEQLFTVSKKKRNNSKLITLV